MEEADDRYVLRYIISGAILRDSNREDQFFLVAALPPEFVQTEQERQEWQHLFRVSLLCPAVIAYWENREEWKLAGRTEPSGTAGG